MSSSAPAPVSSTAQPAQLPALKGPHAGDKKPKEKKAKQAAASEFPLEVCLIMLVTQTCVAEAFFSCSHRPSSSTTVSRFSTSLKQSMMNG